MKLKIILLSVFMTIITSWNFGTAQIIPEIQDTVITEFGVYSPCQVNVNPQIPPYTVQPGLANVAVPSDLRFTEHAKEKLEDNGFVVGTGDCLQMFDVYYDAQNREIPIFVTSDALLHTFHILYDYTLRMLEVKEFYDAVNLMTDLLLDKTAAYLNQTSDPYIQSVLRSNIAFLSVGKILFDPGFDVPANVDSLVLEELNLIFEIKTIRLSPIFGYEEDYSQYIPRGHYTRNDILKQYFRGMMWYGRMMFRLKPGEDDEVNYEGKRATLQALYLIKALMEAQSEPDAAKDLWRKVYYPTVFFVGKTDDLSADDYLPVIEEVYGKNVTSLNPEELAVETKLANFIEQALALRNPMINSSIVDDWEEFQIITKGYRLMGQRFIPDSYMFHKLTHADVAGRMFPKGLDVFAVMGSERALTILLDYFNQSQYYSDYLPAVEQLQEFLRSLEVQAWAQNLYWNWLYTLDPLLWIKGTGYPFFMQNSAWLEKDLYTALGSWAELRHDTILYAKQSYTERVSIEPVDATKGYVEPNPHLFARLAALAGFMRDGLTSKDLSLTVFDQKLSDFEALALSFKTIAEKELNNLTPTDEEYDHIVKFPKRLEELNTFPPDIAGQITSETDDKMAVIADVHTDPNSMQVLEEGVGYPLPIYVVCPIEGNLIVTQGAIFSYYEFTHPLNDRLTDEAWQDMLSSNSPPEKPGWTDSFRDVTLAEHTGEYRHAKEADIVSSVEDNSGTQTQLPQTALMQNYPNPSNPHTTIWYHLEPGGPFHVKITIYNILGQVVHTLVNELKPGDRSYMIVWDGKDMYGMPATSGVYIYTLKTERAFAAKKLVLIK